MEQLKRLKKRSTTILSGAGSIRHSEDGQVSQFIKTIEEVNSALYGSEAGSVRGSYHNAPWERGNRGPPMSREGSSGMGSGGSRTRKRHSPKEVKVTVLPQKKGEIAYGSMDEARKQLRDMIDLIRRNKSMMQGAREREFQIIHEEQFQQSVANPVRGACSYKMPRIKVEARDMTQRHLKKLLENLSGRPKQPGSRKRSLESNGFNNIMGRNLALPNEGVPSVQLPDIHFRDKRQDAIYKES